VNAPLEVLDHGETVAISFDDLLKYHGRSSLAGVAHGFTAMHRAFPLLAGGSPPERHDIRIESAFPGDGARDAFEMVTRAVTGGRYLVDPEIAPPDAPRGPSGRFFFRFTSAATVVEVTLRSGFVSDEFIDVVCQGAETPAEVEKAARMKKEMADRLLGLPADEVYDAAVL
jgi:hypothetical protein